MNKPVTRRLQGKTGPRDIGAYPREEERLGRSLFSRVAAAVPRGRPAPVVFVLRRETIDWFPLRGIGVATAASRRRILAAMAGQDGVECVALVGAFRFQGSGPLNGQWVASVFIEWPDNRWWTAWQPIGDDRRLIGSEPQVRCAVDGSPRPGGIGGWFATSRRLGLKLRVQRNPTPVH